VRGRKPKPTRLKVLTGNPGRRPLNHEEPRPTEKLPERPPAYLGAGGKALWKALRPVVDVMGATLSDAEAFARVCQVGSRVRELEKALQDKGRTYERETENGTVPTARPEVIMLDRSEREYRALLAEFGLTPSSCTRLRVPKGGEQLSEFERFLQGRK
jgi:P27 family predicted phage terminase small subunit